MKNIKLLLMMALVPGLLNLTAQEQPIQPATTAKKSEKQPVPAGYAPPYYYYMKFQANPDVPEITEIKAWVFKKKDHWKEMLEKIGFSEGFVKGFTSVNDVTIKLMPKLGEILDPMAPGMDFVGGFLGGAAKSIGLSVEELAKLSKKWAKQIRIGYANLEDNQYLLKTAKDKDRWRVYLVFSVTDKNRKNMEGFVKKWDMYPLAQGWFQTPVEKDPVTGVHTRYLVITPRKRNIIRDGKADANYDATVSVVSRDQFFASDPAKKDED